MLVVLAIRLASAESFYRFLTSNRAYSSTERLQGLFQFALNIGLYALTLRRFSGIIHSAGFRH